MYGVKEKKMAKVDPDRPGRGKGEKFGPGRGRKIQAQVEVWFI